MDKRSIIVLIIAALIIIGGFVLGDIAKGQMQFGYTYRPPYANGHEASVGNMLMVSRFSMPVGIIIGIAGSLWLIVSAVQKKDN